ncbi:MFS transporter [Plantactinospora sp. GCM10030261]|uniref:MFS transporter n=1 Tax=Plantactinospora sp. GCM10030261 TaxID=3273420 RepID=UPI00360948F7
MRHTTATVVLALACAAQFMVVLDVSVVNVALPSIQRVLDLPPTRLQWVANAYALMFAGFLLLGGRLADLYGRKRTFSAGLGLFTVASLIGGLATTAEVLIAARAMQGLGAAVLAPATLTMLTATFPEGARRTRALAIWTAVSLAGGAAGNLLSGALTQYLTWRSTLLINLPIGATAIALITAVVTDDHPRERAGRLDLPGAMLATVGLATLTYGITAAHTDGWVDPAPLTALSTGLTALTAFVLTQARTTRQPLLPLRLLRPRAIWLGNLLTLLVGAAFQISMWYFLTLYMQHVLGFTALQTGLGFLPHTLLTLLVGLRLTPWLMRHIPSRTLIATGGLVAAAGFWWQSHLTADSTYWSGVLAPATALSIGGGLLVTPLTATVTSGVPTADAGAASGLMNTTKQVGGAVGLATLITLTNPGSGTPQQPATAYSHAFAITAMALAAVAPLALALPARPDPLEHRRARGTSSA